MSPLALPIWEARAVESGGGTVTVRVAPGAVEFVSAVPAPGFVVEVDDEGPTRVRVQLESEARVRGGGPRGRTARPGVPARGRGRPSRSVGPRPARYLHREALEVLPQVMENLVDDSPVLIGHSDGASMAIIAAGAGLDVAAIVLIAPDVFVEPEAVAGIDAVVALYRQGDLSDCLARQAEDDEYATVAQLDRIEVGMTVEPERWWVPTGVRSPHLTVTDAVSEASSSASSSGLRVAGQRPERLRRLT